MAKRIVKWSLDGSILKMAKALESTAPEGFVNEIMAEFDLIKIYPTFDSMNDVQQQAIVYGVKQKLADVGSQIGESAGKVGAAKKQWERFLLGHFDGERVNATGAAENRRVISEVKKAAEVVSLQGLLIKQTLYPEKFTEEDKVKLAEFLDVMVKSSGKSKK